MSISRCEQCRAILDFDVNDDFDDFDDFSARL